MAMPRREPAPSLSGSCPMSERSEAPGDEAAPGTPGTGEDICPACGGTGRKNNQICPNCNGTGKIIEGIGGG